MIVKGDNPITTGNQQHAKLPSRHQSSPQQIGTCTGRKLCAAQKKHSVPTVPQNITVNMIVVSKKVAA